MKILFSFLLAFILLTGFSLGYRYFLAEPTGKVELEERTTSGAAQQYSYDYFFDLCTAIQGYEGALLSQRSLLTTAKGDTLSQVQTNVAAIEAQRFRTISQYNNDVRKSKTVARYKSRGLPDYINPQAGTTTCVN